MISSTDVQPIPKLERRQALDAVLRSSTLGRNPRLSALLEYLCLHSLEGEKDCLKEYNIATDVFRRPADFDQSTDAIVRVEMHRLRKKLKEFYAGEGLDQPLEIVIQSGQYVPEFVSRRKSHEVEPSTENRALEAASDSTFSSAHAVSPLEQKQSRFKRARLWALALVAVMVAVFAVFATGALKRYSGSASLPRSSSLASLPVSPAVSGDAVRILCGQSGSGYRDRQGNQWGPDAFFSGGSPVEVPAQPIYRTRDPHLFQAMRAGEFTYKIPLKPGVYELRLYFADTSYTPGPSMEGGENVRTFDVFLNGKMLLPLFDITADAGPSTADVRVFKDVSPTSDGYLYLKWSKQVNTPLVNAIEIVPGVAHHLRPVRIVTQDNSFTDHSGVLWSADDYFLGGRTVGRFGTVAGPADPQLYGRERYGNFSYAIPVADGRYAVRLYFAETYFGPKGSGNGEAGSRVFNVYCNGTALLRRFDMLSEAGTYRQIIKTFHGLEPNAQGKLLLSFVPVTNYANLSGLEVVDESP